MRAGALLSMSDRASVSARVSRRGARSSTSRSLASRSTGKPVARAKPTLPVTPHASWMAASFGVAHESARRQGNSASKTGNVCAAPSTTASGVSRRSMRGALTWPATRSDRLIPRTPTGTMSSSRVSSRRTTTGTCASQPAVSHAGAGSLSIRSRASAIQSRSCGRMGGSVCKAEAPIGGGYVIYSATGFRANQRCASANDGGMSLPVRCPTQREGGRDRARDWAWEGCRQDCVWISSNNLTGNNLI